MSLLVMYYAKQNKQLKEENDSLKAKQKIYDMHEDEFIPISPPIVDELYQLTAKNAECLEMLKEAVYLIENQYEMSPKKLADYTTIVIRQSKKVIQRMKGEI